MGNEKSGLMGCGLNREAHEQEAGEGEARRAGAGPGGWSGGLYGQEPGGHRAKPFRATRSLSRVWTRVPGGTAALV